MRRAMITWIECWNKTHQCIPWNIKRFYLEKYFQIMARVYYNYCITKSVSFPVNLVLLKNDAIPEEILFQYFNIFPEFKKNTIKYCLNAMYFSVNEGPLAIKYCISQRKAFFWQYRSVRKVRFDFDIDDRITLLLHGRWCSFFLTYSHPSFYNLLYQDGQNPISLAF